MIDSWEGNQYWKGVGVQCPINSGKQNPESRSRLIQKIENVFEKIEMRKLTFYTYDS
jgi:hypothetical protein